MSDVLAARRRLPPVWLMGLTNATFGFYGGFAVVTLPEMLARQGIPGGQIAAIVAAVLSPGFWVFLLSPALDVRFSRRTYALVFSALGALAMGFTVAHRSNVTVMEGAIVFGYACACMVQNAVGGWMGSLVGDLKNKADDSRLGAWFAVSNTGAGGLMILFAGEAILRLPPVAAGVLLGGVELLPALLYLAIPAPGPDRRLARESFTQFFGQIGALLKRREVLVAMVLFILPSSSFALTNLFGGIGKDFSATERMVSLLGGVGAAVAGVASSLLLPGLAKKLALRPLYLCIGIAGGLFTLSLLLLPHTPLTFGIAFLGENAFQALAFAAGNAITFETIGQDNPLAATQFALLLAATNLPIILMGVVDGRAYTARGVAGALVADAGISIAVCLALGAGLVWLGRRAWVKESGGKQPDYGRT